MFLEKGFSQRRMSLLFKQMLHKLTFIYFRAESTLKFHLQLLKTNRQSRRISARLTSTQGHDVLRPLPLTEVAASHPAEKSLISQSGLMISTGKLGMLTTFGVWGRRLSWVMRMRHLPCSHPAWLWQRSHNRKGLLPYTPAWLVFLSPVFQWLLRLIITPNRRKYSREGRNHF